MQTEQTESQQVLINAPAWLKEIEIRRNPPTQMMVPEAALYLGISERKLRDDLAQRKFKSIRLGNRIILRKKDIDSYLDEIAS